MKPAENFYRLTPDQVLNAIELAGFFPTGEYIQLNSYENRVFDIRIEEDAKSEELRGRVIAKFYRPQRWSKEALLEEHQFLMELKEKGIPVVAPLVQNSGQTIREYNGMYMSLFPKAFGRLPQELSDRELQQIGRTLARIHNIGEQFMAHHRPTLSAENFGWASLDFLRDWVAPEMWSRYEKAAVDILYLLEDHLDPKTYLRIHGDCHKGNLLLTDVQGKPKEFFFVDFDDFCNGPAVQDFWMLFSCDESENLQEQESILSGYEELRILDRDQLHLMAPLRGLRIIHYAAWIARRWRDPSFPALFPQFRSYTYWAQEVEALEKIAWTL